jgi:uncharacterized protein (DUF305 family)
MKDASYRRLLVMVALSFIAMYVLMYAMVNSLQNVYMSFNQVYMAGLMAAPMALIELALMRGMYQNNRLNAVVAGVSLIALVLFWVLIRQQAAIGDSQFLRSMIPHHAGAILMCEQSPIHDAEIRTLCKSIISSQQAEIDQMKAVMERLQK